jgi:hypothetical protein
MLTEVEFVGVKHIILDKPEYTYIMNRGPLGWDVHTIPKNWGCIDLTDHESMSEDDAYEFYRERMASFGYKRFQVIVE